MGNGQTIDSLQVEITATAKDVSSVFTAMTSQLTMLKNAINGINASQLTAVQKQISSLSSSVSKSSASASTSGMTKAEKSISTEVDKIRYKLLELKNIKEAALGGDNSAVTSFGRKVVSIQSAIDILNYKLKAFGNTSVPTEQFSKLESQIDSAKARLTELQTTYKQATSGEINLSDEQYATLRAEISACVTEISNLQDKQDELINSGEAFTDPFGNYRDGIESMEGELASAKAEISSLNGQDVNVSTGDTPSRLSEIADKAKEVASSLLSITASGIKTGFTTLKSSLSGIKSTLTSIGSKATSSVSTGFSKILKYGFGIRSLYVLFRRLRTAVKDSFTELQNSGAYYQTTAANVNALKNSLTTLKYQFGAAFEPIFNTIAPALQTLINYLVSAMNTISAFIAKLTGKSTYSKAVVATSEIASNTGSAADSASDLNKQLQGFDELNNLSGDSGSGGGGSSGGSSDSSDVTYVEASVESALGDFTSDLIDMIKDGDWEGVGSALSSKITDALNGINWTTIKEKASTFGTNLANFFNGFITTDLFSSIGSTLAESLNTGFTFLDSFGTTFNWDNFGNSIGEGINTFFEDADFELYGDTVHTWVGGILDAGISLLETTDFELIGEKLGDFFDSLQVDDLLDKVKTLCSRIITAIGKTITGFQNSASEKTKLETAIGALLGVLAITKSIPVTLTLAATLGGIWLGGKFFEILSGNEVEESFFEEITDICDGLFGENKIDFNIASAIKFVWDDLTGKHSEDSTGITGFSRAGFTTALTTMINPYLSGVLVWIDIGEYIQLKWSNLASSLSELWSKLKTEISNFWNGGTYSELMKGANGMASEAAEHITYSSGFKQELQEMGSWIVLGIKEGMVISLKTNPFTAPVVLLYEAIRDAVKGKFEIDSPAKAMYDLGEYIFKGIIQGFIEAMNGYSWNDLANDLYDLFTGTERTGLTAQGDFSSSDAVDKTHSKTGKSGNGGGSSVKFNVTYNTKLTGDAKSKTDLTNLSDSFNNLSKAASQGGSASYDAKTGGQLTSIDDVDNWKTKFRNLYNQWVGKNVTMSATVGGQMASINDTETWIEKIQKLDREWQNASSTSSFDVNSNVSNLDGEGGYLERLNKAKEKWKGGTAEFNTKLTGSATSKTDIDNLGSSFEKLGKYPSGQHTGTWTTNITGKSASEINTYASAAKNLYDKFYSGTYNATYSVTVSGSTSGIDGLVNAIKDKLNSKLGNYKLKFINTNAALGGIITSSGVKKSIPQYAGGTLNAGSVFVAGEAGPEIMGHINGRTEILNRSQIASIMNSSYLQAMSHFGQRMLATPEGMALRSNGYTTYQGAGTDNSDVIREQNALLSEQNDLLRQIASKNVTISGREVFNATRSEANSYYNRTGNSPFLF